jgi:hypothetical protein
MAELLSIVKNGLRRKPVEAELFPLVEKGPAAAGPLQNK